LKKLRWKRNKQIIYSRDQDHCIIGKIDTCKESEHDNLWLLWFKSDGEGGGVIIFLGVTVSLNLIVVLVNPFEMTQELKKTKLTTVNPLSLLLSSYTVLRQFLVLILRWWICPLGKPAQSYFPDGKKCLRRYM